MPVSYQVLQQGVAQRLGHAALDLALDLLAIDRLAHVVDADHVQHLHLPGQQY